MPADLDQRLSALMARAQDGDRRAYEALLVAVAALVERFARNRVRQADACEEIVQDTLLAIHRDRHTTLPQLGGRRQRNRRQRPDRNQQNIRVRRAAKHIHALDSFHGFGIGTHRSLRKADRGWAVFDRERLAELFTKRGGIAWGGDSHARHHAQKRQIPHAVVAGPVVISM